MITLTALSVDFSIDIYPNTAAVQAAVQTELEDLILNTGGSGQTIRLSDMYAAINEATGLLYWRLDPPAADSAAGYGQVHTLGTITFGDY